MVAAAVFVGVGVGFVRVGDGDGDLVGTGGCSNSSFAVSGSPALFSYEGEPSASAAALVSVVARLAVAGPVKATAASGTSCVVAPPLVTSAVTFLVPESMRKSESLTSKPWPVGGAGEEKVTLP